MIVGLENRFWSLLQRPFYTGLTQEKKISILKGEMPFKMHKIKYFQKILGKNLGITSKFRCGQVTLNTGIFYFGLRELVMLKPTCSATKARLYLENLDENKMQSL